MLERNIAQEEAIETTEGPVIVIACPGSGKTTTLIRRIHRMVEKGVNPKKILMITFAKSAAVDMKERYVKLYGENSGVSFMTIHSLCFTILKRELNYDVNSILSEQQTMEFFVNQLKYNSDISDAWEMAKTILTELSAVRNSYTPIATYNPTGCDRNLFVSLYNAYESEKRQSGKIDYDDMLIRCEDLLSTDESVRNRWSSYFDYIQVDEYQDTNQIQKSIIGYLINRTNNLCVVGDDDQSLYSWRGADPSIMMNFKKDYPEAKEIYMSTNYRSAQRIVDYADALIKRNKVRFKKDFLSFRGKAGQLGEVEFIKATDKTSEISSIVSKIKYLHDVEKVDYKDMAILIRNNNQAELPVDLLSNQSIPFTSTEKIKSIYESYIFKDIRSYVELSLGKNVKANLYTVINHPNRYLSYKQFKDIPFEFQSYLNAISSLRYSGPSWRYDAAEKAIGNLFVAFGTGRVTLDTPPKKVLSLLENPEMINYIKHLENVSKMKKSPLQDELDLFEHIKKEAEQFTTVKEWFKYADEMIKKTDKANKEKDSNGVKITTMHKSKGLEWKCVFVIGVDRTIMPGRKALDEGSVEEERRVLYVAMTRAEDRLFVSHSGEPSSFLTLLHEDYKEKVNPFVKKKLPGSKVVHSTYGKGKVVRYVDDSVLINFDNGGLKKILFPETFQKGICSYE